jgi:catabolite regulation protein CreA
VNGRALLTAALATLLLGACGARAEQVGAVDTVFKFIGPDHKIVVDAQRNTLVYMTYSDRVIEGSPQNSVTAVPVPRSTPIPLGK